MSTVKPSAQLGTTWKKIAGASCPGAIVRVVSIQHSTESSNYDLITFVADRGSPWPIWRLAFEDHSEYLGCAPDDGGARANEPPSK